MIPLKFFSSTFLDIYRKLIGETYISGLKSMRQSQMIPIIHDINKSNPCVATKLAWLVFVTKNAERPLHALAIMGAKHRFKHPFLKEQSAERKLQILSIAKEIIDKFDLPLDFSKETSVEGIMTKRSDAHWKLLKHKTSADCVAALDTISVLEPKQGNYLDSFFYGIEEKSKTLAMQSVKKLQKQPSDDLLDNVRTHFHAQLESVDRWVPNFAECTTSAEIEIKAKKAIAGFKQYMDAVWGAAFNRSSFFSSLSEESKQFYLDTVAKINQMAIVKQDALQSSGDHLAFPKGQVDSSNLALEDNKINGLRC